MPAQAIIALILAAIDILERAPEIIAKLKQNAELTPEQEAQLDERIAGLKNQPHWKL